MGDTPDGDLSLLTEDELLEVIYKCNMSAHHAESEGIKRALVEFVLLAERELERRRRVRVGEVC